MWCNVFGDGNVKTFILKSDLCINMLVQRYIIRSHSSGESCCYSIQNKQLKLRALYYPCLGAYHSFNHNNYILIKFLVACLKTSHNKLLCWHMNTKGCITY